MMCRLPRRHDYDFLEARYGHKSCRYRASLHNAQARLDANSSIRAANDGAIVLGRLHGLNEQISLWGVQHAYQPATAYVMTHPALPPPLLSLSHGDVLVDLRTPQAGASSGSGVAGGAAGARRRTLDPALRSR
jgi:hypothetical protein